MLKRVQNVQHWQCELALRSAPPLPNALSAEMDVVADWQPFLTVLSTWQGTGGVAVQQGAAIGGSSSHKRPAATSHVMHTGRAMHYDFYQARKVAEPATRVHNIGQLSLSVEAASNGSSITPHRAHVAAAVSRCCVSAQRKLTLSRSAYSSIAHSLVIAPCRMSTSNSLIVTQPYNAAATSSNRSDLPYKNFSNRATSVLEP